MTADSHVARGNSSESQRRGAGAQPARAPGRLVRRGIPAYQQLADWLREDIASGIYPTGALLPTVPELAARFRLGQQTVRKALAQLKNVGIISVRRRGGTRVEGVLSDMGVVPR